LTNIRIKKITTCTFIVIEVVYILYRTRYRQCRLWPGHSCVYVGFMCHPL